MCLRAALPSLDAARAARPARSPLHTESRMSLHPLTDITFESFDLHPRLLSGLHGAGFTRCTPIQALTLPIALAGRDVAGQAQTGTGKTAAFLVAVLNRMLTQPARTERKLTDPRAVIVAPTRELAIQIDKDFRGIGHDTGLTSALIYGGVDYEKQRDSLKAGCDLIIATPGRLIDYLKQNVFSFRAIEAVVIDEADRMFDLGFIKDIRFLLRRMPPREERQGMLFSATLSHRVLELAYEHMNSPEKVTAETETVTADRVRQLVYFPAKEEKLPLLVNLLSRIDAHRSIVFVNTKIAAEKVTRTLERHGFSVATLSGDVPQAKRERLLAKFQKGEIELLVATDVAARGLHISAVSHVFNYDLPHDAEDYVHRIGRTARLGAEGDAISFACDLYAMGLPDIEAYIEQKIPTAPITADLLAAVPPRARATAALATSDVDEAADDARNTAGAPPKSAAPSRSGRTPTAGPTGVGRGRGQAPASRAPRGATPSLPPREARVPRAPAAGATDEAAESPSLPGDAIRATGDAADGHAAAEGAPRKRSRRGGRGRKRHDEAVPGSAMEAGTTAPPAPSKGAAPRTNGPSHKVERKPHREHPPRGDHAKSASTHAPQSPTPAKPGFFRRIARLFNPH
jgi:ATP-dependent RNA helicase RhlB